MDIGENETISMIDKGWTDRNDQGINDQEIMQRNNESPNIRCNCNKYTTLG